MYRSRGRLKLLIMVFTFEDLAYVLISILSLLSVGGKVVSTSRTLGDWVWLCSPTALAWVPFPSLMSTYSGVFFLGSFGLSPSAKNQYFKLKFDVEKVDRNSHLLYYRTQNYKSNCTIYTTKNDSHYILIAQKMLESQICLWCIFVNNLPDKVS